MILVPVKPSTLHYVACLFLIHITDCTLASEKQLSLASKWRACAQLIGHVSVRSGKPFLIAVDITRVYRLL